MAHTTSTYQLPFFIEVGSDMEFSMFNTHGKTQILHISNPLTASNFGDNNISPCPKEFTEGNPHLQIAYVTWAEYFDR